MTVQTGSNSNPGGWFGLTRNGTREGGDLGGLITGRGLGLGRERGVGNGNDDVARVDWEMKVKTGRV